MALKLRQSTADQEVPLGYFLDSTNGNDEETGLTIANTDIKIWKHGATTVTAKNSGGATHIENGIFYAVFDATDTNTLGNLVIFIHVAGALAIKVECEVLTANRYDSEVLGTDVLQVDVTQIGGDAQSATDLKDFADAGYDPGTNKVQGVVLVDTTTANTDLVSAADVVDEFETQSQADPTGFHVNVLEIDGTAQTANDVGADVDTILSESNPGLTYVGTVSGIVSQTIFVLSGSLPLSDCFVGQEVIIDDGFSIGSRRCTAFSVGDDRITIESAMDFTVGVGDVVKIMVARGTNLAALASVCTETRLAELDNANIPTDIANVKSETALIVADTNELQADWVNGGRLDLILDIIAADTTTDIPALIAALNNISTAQVNTEVDTALTDLNLDHLVKSAVDTNFATTVHLDSVVGQMADVGTSATFDRTTDSQEAIRDKQTDIETDTAEIGTAGAGLTDLGGMSTGMKGEVNAEADTALTDYDPPTDTEMIARTLPTADYVVTTDTIAGVTTTTNLTNAPTNGDLTATMKTSVNTEAKDVLTVDTISDSYATDGNQPTIAQAILAIQQMMQDKSISGTTLTVKKPDGSTTAMTFTLDSATTPTSITRAT